MEEAGIRLATIQRDDQGDYRWTYDMKAQGNNAPYRFMVGVALAVALPVAIALLVMLWQYGAAQALMFAGGLLAVVVGLPALIWKLASPNPSFRMSETEIEAWPQGRGRNIHPFSSVRRVTMRPDIDRIQLRETLGSLHVYVPREDYDFVRDFILARVPKGTEVFYG